MLILTVFLGHVVALTLRNMLYCTGNDVSSTHNASRDFLSSVSNNPCQVWHGRARHVLLSAASTFLLHYFAALYGGCQTAYGGCVVQTKAFGTDMTPIARPAQPAEYGPPAVFLATNDSSYVVGAILSVTGGMLIN